MLPGYWDSITNEIGKVPYKMEHTVTVKLRNVHIGGKKSDTDTTSVIWITENHRKLSQFLSSHFNGFKL